MEFFECTIGELLEEAASKDPSHPALIYSDRELRYTFSELNARVDQLAKRLLCFGVTLGVMAACTHWATLVPLETFDPLMVLAVVQKERCTALYGVPTMFIGELTHPMFNMFDLQSLRTGIMAGSPCPEPVMRRSCRRCTVARLRTISEAQPAVPGA